MIKPVMGLTALTLSIGAASAPADAHLRRGHVVSIQGSHGRGLVQSRSVSRQPGSASVTRSLQTNDGRGYQASRSHSYGPGHYEGNRSVQANDGRGYQSARAASWGNGSYAGSHTITTNSGSSIHRSTTATNHGDGTASYSTSVAGPNGNSRTISGTVHR